MSNVKNVECNFKVKIIYKFIRRRLTREEERRRKRLKHKINFNSIMGARFRNRLGRYDHYFRHCFKIGKFQNNDAN